MNRILFTMLAMLALAGGLARAQDDDPTGPQPKLPTEQLTIISDDGKSHVFNVEIASTMQQQMTGLMFRRKHGALLPERQFQPGAGHRHPGIAGRNHPDTEYQRRRQGDCQADTRGLSERVSGRGAAW